jgi:hypothetical protein
MPKVSVICGAKLSQRGGTSSISKPTGLEIEVGHSRFKVFIVTSLSLFLEKKAVTLELILLNALIYF